MMAAILPYATVAILSAVTLCQNIVDLIHYDRLDGKSCTLSLFETVARSDTSCRTRCAMEPTCLSSFYTPNTKRCIGCESVYNDSDLSPLTNEPGSVYYRPYAYYNQACSSIQKPCIESNTVCFPGLDVCVCDPAFVYDPTSASCQADCTMYGLTYQMYPKYVLVGYDAASQGAQNDVDSCLLYCSHNITSFQCYSVDYDYVGKICYYNNERNANAPTVWLYSPAVFDTYVRNCA